MMSSSDRKRRENDLPDEVFPVPQFEKGRKSVPQSELEHVLPGTSSSSVRSISSEEIEKIKVQIQEKLEQINKCITDINSLTKDVQSQENSIINILNNL